MSGRLSRLDKGRRGPYIDNKSPPRDYFPMTFAAPRTPSTWRSPRLAGLVALLFTALTLLAAAPHRHAAGGVAEGRTACAQRASRASGATLATAATVSATSSCALCDWLTLPSLPTSASPARLARTVCAFVAWLPAPASPIRARILSWQRPRGPPAIALS